MWWEIIFGISGAVILAYSLLLLFISYRFRKLPDHELLDLPSSITPSVSIIVPFRNEKDTLSECVYSLIKASRGITYFQLILVDDHSEDGSSDIGITLAKEIEEVQYLESDGLGKKHALSLGIQIARNDWIFTSDADCIYPPTSIFQLLTRVKQNGLDIGCIPVVSKPSQNLLQAYDCLESHGIQAVTAVALNEELFLSASGAALLYPKKVFQQLQPFKDNMHIPSGDDQFFLYSYRKVYNKTIYFLKNPHMVVRTKPVQVWKELLSQRLRWSGKSAQLKDPKLKVIMGLIISSDLLIISLLLLSLIANNILFGALLLWFFKVMAEVLLLTTSNQYWRYTGSLKYLPAVALIRPFFHLALIIFHLLNRRNYWKGRLINS